MLNRWIGIALAALMVLANASLIVRDLLPQWRVGEAPPSEAQCLRPGEERLTQVGIYDEEGRCLGQSWTRSRRSELGEVVQAFTSTVLLPIPLPGGVRTPHVRVETALSFRYGEAAVDELDFRVFGLPVPVTLHGEAMPSGEFPVRWQIGPEHDEVVLDSRAPAALGDVIRPFDRLPDLYVGRSWRHNLLDPLSQILPQLRTVGLGLEAVVIEVTRTETLVHGGESYEAFVVEGAGATAWVAPDGRVLRQEVTLPLLGHIVLLDEPYDEKARSAAMGPVLKQLYEPAPGPPAGESP